MLHVIIGTDRKRARVALWKAARAAAEKENARIAHVSEGESAARDIRESLQGSGLFGERRILVCDEVCRQDDARAALFSLLPHCAKISTPCFVYEEKPDAEAKRLLKKHAKTWEEHTAEKKEQDDGAFAVANAFAKRDKKTLWVSYVRALARGASPEVIHGILFWKVKTMLSSGGGTAFREQELRTLVATLSALPHEARRGGMDMEYALERFLLGCV